MIVGQALPPNSKGCRVRFRITANQQNALALLGHHVAEVRQREGFTNTAFAIDRDDLGFAASVRLAALPAMARCASSRKRWSKSLRFGTSSFTMRPSN